MDDKLEFITLRQTLISREFSKMNDQQRAAVFRVEGPILILAGAGSGKTTVVVNRIANMVLYGNSYTSQEMPDNITKNDIATMSACVNSRDKLPEVLRDKMSVGRVDPSNILAITFTNKAARELKERLYIRLAEKAGDLWVSTFHSTCARILRRFGNRIGYSNHFTIYDTTDVKALLKECLKQLDINDKAMDHKYVSSQISKAKNDMLSPEEYEKSVAGDYRLEKVAKIYKLYQEHLVKADAMDFDDLIINTILLFKKENDVLEYYRDKFKYIMVDEYQDTNDAQCVFLNLLSSGHKNLCVVGDDDQSIYKFRGANIQNIMNFEKMFPNAFVIKLEQNYRSTGNILNAANSVISHNSSRKGKKLWTQNSAGDKIFIYTSNNEMEEANYIVNAILDKVASGKKYSDMAVLYRINSLSNTIERTFAKSGIPYRVIGGHRFYERKEIKDLLAYLSVINNTDDEIRLRRIINTPRRSIGDRTVNEIVKVAEQENRTLYSVMKDIESFPGFARSAHKIRGFINIIEELREAANDESVSLGDLYQLILQKVSYREYLQEDIKEGPARLENVEELASNIIAYQEENQEEASLEGFLEEVSLITDVDNYDENSDAVVLMTIHSAKGLEFPVVFLPGFEEGIFPGIKAVFDQEEIEEERRLAYVAITRAKEDLYILNSDRRMLFGSTSRNKQSRFAEEIPSEFADRKRAKEWIKPDKDFKMPKTSGEMRKESLTAAMKFGQFHEYKLDKEAVQYSIDDIVDHKVFGRGRIKNVTKMGNDHLLEIVFDKVGLKKIMSNYSRLNKLESK